MTTKKANKRTTAKKDTTDEDVARTFAEIMEAKEAPRISVPMSLSTSLLDEREAIRREFSSASLLAARDGLEDDAKEAAQKEADRLEKEYLKADKAVKAATHTFVFEATSRRTIEAQLIAHPPTDAQVANAEATARAVGVPIEQVPTYNAETFPPVLMAECSIDPVMTEDEAAELWDSEKFARGELSILWSAVWNLNNGIRR